MPCRLIPWLLLALVALPARAQDPPWKEYDALLKRWVDDQGRVDYAGWKKKDEAALREVVASFAKVDPDKLQPAARKAYWIDVYNALIIQGILEFWPLGSIKDKVSDQWSILKDYKFGPSQRSLDGIEHMILRKLGDPRVHGAIVCGARSSPPLRREAYVPERLDAQLDENVRAWLANENALEVEGESVKISMILAWFKEDFGADEQALKAWVAKFLSGERRAALLKPGLKTGRLEYDWALNSH